MPALLAFADAFSMPTRLLAQMADPATEFSLLDKVLGHPEVMFFGFLTTVIVVPTLARMWISMRTKEWEASLKHAMLERGMSAEEIKMVLEAGSGRDAGRKKCGNAEVKAGPACFAKTEHYSEPQGT